MNLDLTQIQKLSNGARFYRIDLHNHTPADRSFHCRNFSLITEQEKETFAREYVRFAKEEQGLDIIGVTDHNTIEWTGLIQKAGREIGLAVLPGVELGANEGKRQVHYLALFGPETKPAEIDHFISSVGLTPKNRFDHSGHPRLTKNSCTDLTQKITTADDGLPGIAIAAHVTRKNGLLHELEGESRVMAWEDPNLIAIEIPGSKSRLKGFNKQLITGKMDAYGNRSIACLNSSDGRGIGQTDTKERKSIGENGCRVRLSHTGVNMISALRHAFIDHDSRIRLDGDHVDEKYAKIIGVTVENGFLSGREPAEPFMVHLNQNLNTVIGGRGTGKSSLLEALRFVFDVEGKTAQTRGQSQQAIGVTLPAGARVKAWYETAEGMMFEIRRDVGKPPQVFAAESGQQIDIPPKNLIPDGLPLEIYGQKEVYEIANDIEFQLNLLDSYIAEPLREIRREESDLTRQLEANAQQMMWLDDEMADHEQSLADLPAIKLEIQRLEKDATLDQLQHKKGLEQEKVVLSQLEAEIENRLAQLNSVSLKLKKDGLESAEPFPASRQSLANIDKLIEKTRVQLQQQIGATWEQAADERTAWQADYNQSEQGYRELLKQHGNSLSIERYFDLQEKQTALETLAGQQSERHKSLNLLKEARQTLLDQLNELRQERLFEIRQQKAADLNQLLTGTVRVELTRDGNQERYAEFLIDLFKRHNARVNKKVVDSIVAAKKSPPELAQAIRAEAALLDETLSPLEHLFGVSEAYRKRLIQIDEAGLFELELFDVPDRPDIQLRVGEVYRSLTPPAGVAGLSTGQKCTAILSLILVERNTPLIIDQPEDDLDNAFIFSEIVQTLRREKERRQFIIATHNANIPVSGDAELIMLMKADAQHGWIECAGSIDDPAIREPVENILEGGREAFRLRQSKYNI
ncbi:MAG: putative metal-dependent phosphoesterase TrpH [Cellvibrionaceae bacterium]